MYSLGTLLDISCLMLPLCTMTSFELLDMIPGGWLIITAQCGIKSSSVNLAHFHSYYTVILWWGSRDSAHNSRPLKWRSWSPLWFSFFSALLTSLYYAHSATDKGCTISLLTVPLLTKNKALAQWDETQSILNGDSCMCFLTKMSAVIAVNPHFKWNPLFYLFFFLGWWWWGLTADFDSVVIKKMHRFICHP